jgi:hypothetical protein
VWRKDLAISTPTINQYPHEGKLKHGLEAVREYLPWEHGNVHARGLVLEHVAEGFKVGVALAHKVV